MREDSKTLINQKRFLMVRDPIPIDSILKANIKDDKNQKSQSTILLKDVEICDSIAPGVRLNVTIMHSALRTGSFIRAQMPA